MLGKGGAVLGVAAAVLLVAGGVGAAFAVQPDATPAPASRANAPVVPVLDQAPTTTTTTPPAAPHTAATPAAVAGGGGGNVTITIAVKR